MTAKMSAMALALAVSLLGACAAPQEVDRTANSDVKVEGAASTNRVFAYQRLVSSAQRAEPFATIKVGLACIPRAQAGWNTGNFVLSEQEYERIVQEEFTAAGYRMTAGVNTGELFSDRRPAPADFRIAGLMSKMKMNVCYPLAGFGDAYRGTGEASLTVEWQIYSEKTKGVVFTTTKAGFASVDSSIPGVAKELIQRALVQSIRAMLTDPGFRAIGGRS